MVRSRGKTGRLLPSKISKASPLDLRAAFLLTRSIPIALQQRRDAMLNQLSEFAKQKPKASETVRLENDLREIEASHRVLSDQSVSPLHLTIPVC